VCDQQEVARGQPKLGVGPEARGRRLQPESDRKHTACGRQQRDGNRFVSPGIHAGTPD
jgi:hypothetical protein